jgi:hypothetical protein
MRAKRYCLWGWRRGYIQIGSPTDRRIQIELRMVADLDRLMAEIGSRLMAPVKRVVAEMSEIAATLGR